MPWVRNNDGDWVWEDEPPPYVPPVRDEETPGYRDQPAWNPDWNIPASERYRSPQQAIDAWDPYGDQGLSPTQRYLAEQEAARARQEGSLWNANQPDYGTGSQSPWIDPRTGNSPWDAGGWQGGYPDPSGGALPGINTPGPYGGQRGSDYEERYGKPVRSDTNRTQQDTTNRDQRGGGGGGWSPPPPPDPLAWMNDFGGKDFIKMFLKKPGEKLADYYARLGGDPVKTLIAKYQEIKGMDPDMNMRSLAIGALGLTGMIDPTTLEEVFSMPQSDYLGRLMKAGPSMANLTRFKTPSGGGQGGLRTLKGNDWWSMSNSMRTWAPVEAAKPPTFTAV